MSNSLRRMNSMHEHLCWVNERLGFRELFQRVDQTLETVEALITENAKPRRASKRRGARVEYLPKKMAKVSEEQEPVNSVAEEELMLLDGDAMDINLFTVD